MATQRYSNQQIVDALAKTDGMVYLAADKVGCHATTIYARAKKVKMVQQAIDHHRGKLLDIGELRLRSAVLKGDPWAVAFLLKTIGKHRGYTERQELSGPDGGPIVVKWPDNGNGDAGDHA